MCVQKLWNAIELEQCFYTSYKADLLQRFFGLWSGSHQLTSLVVP